DLALPPICITIPRHIYYFLFLRVYVFSWPSAWQESLEIVLVVLVGSLLMIANAIGFVVLYFI
ncbi:MAG: hypothetical protein ACI3X4_05615, partial [Bacteroidaceae bacterium]